MDWSASKEPSPPVKSPPVEPAEGDHKRKGMPTWMKFAIGIAIVIGLFILGLIPKIRNNRRLDADAKTEATAPPKVLVVHPRLAIPDSVTLPGNIQAIRETSLQPRTTGYITKLYVDIGDRVKKGQILADVEAPDVDQQYYQAVAQTGQAAATVEQSESEVQRLGSAISASEAQVLQSRASQVAATAAVDSAMSQKHQAEANLLAARAQVTDRQQQVSVQRAALAQANANYTLAATTERRERALLEEGFVAQQDYDQAEATRRDMAAAVDSAKASVESAVADLRSAEQTAQANVEAVRAAQGQEDAAAAQLKGAKANVRAAAANLAQSRSSLNSGRNTVRANQAAEQASAANQKRFEVLQSFKHIIAPFDGVITTTNTNIGSLITPGQSTTADVSQTTPSTGVYGLASLAQLRAYVSLPQADYLWAPRGRAVRVFVRELPNRVFRGTVYNTSGALDQNTRTLMTEVRIDNPDGVLLPGMFSQVEFQPANQRELRIPSSAILVDAQGTKVVVIDAGNHIHYRSITLGRDYGTEAEVVRGIQVTDRLVGNATDTMEDGQLVSPQEPKPQGQGAGGPGGGGNGASGGNNGGAGDAGSGANGAQGGPAGPGASGGGAAPGATGVSGGQGTSNGASSSSPPTGQAASTGQSGQTGQGPQPGQGQNGQGVNGQGQNGVGQSSPGQAGQGQAGQGQAGQGQGSTSGTNPAQPATGQLGSPNGQTGSTSGAPAAPGTGNGQGSTTGLGNTGMNSPASNSGPRGGNGNSGNGRGGSGSGAGHGGSSGGHGGSGGGSSGSGGAGAGGAGGAGGGGGGGGH